MERLLFKTLPGLLYILNAVGSAAASTLPPALPCDPDSVPYQGECIHILSGTSYKWLDADEACKRLTPSARLVTIIDQDMNDFLAGQITDDVWIGMHDTHKEGSWRWVDDSPVNYTNFNSGGASDQRGDAPIADTAIVSLKNTTNCVALDGDTGKWKDVSCDSLKGKICALPRGEPLCPDGGTFFRDRCYWYNLVNNWDNANRECEERYGNGVKLVIVRDAKLNAFLSRHVHPKLWLGLRYNDHDETWRWVDGSPLAPDGYERWQDGELDNMGSNKDCAVLNNDGYWLRSFCTVPRQRNVCALQTCYDGPSGGSGSGNVDEESPDEEQNCLDFGDRHKCSCVSSAPCRLTGECVCEALFHGMKCDKDELAVTIHAPNHLELGSNVTMRCHVNLPSTDVTVLWQKVSGTEMLPEGRTRLLDRPELGDYNLVIENMQEDDTGSYVCAATTVIGQIGKLEMDSTYLHVAVGSATASTLPSALPCDPDSVPYQGECIHILGGTSYKWLDADEACKRLTPSARLVTIIDQDMNDFLAGQITDDVWIGMHDTHKEGSWRWVDDSPVNYTNFNSGGASDQRGDAPIADTAIVSLKNTTNCVALDGDTGKWKDVSCDSWKGKICALPRGEPLCPNGGTFFRDRCYWYNLVNNWDNANRECEERYGNGVKLVIVRDAELNAFLSRHVHPQLWLGLRYNDHDETWRWVDGSPLAPDGYERWRDGVLDEMGDEKDCAVLNYDNMNGGYWSRSYCRVSRIRNVCALQTCYDGPSGGSGSGNVDEESPDEEQNCLDFGDRHKCSCVSSAPCRLTGECVCEALFHGMKCDKDELAVTIHAPNHLELGSNVTMRCHVNLPSTDVTVLWQKVSGTEMLPEGRTRLLDRPELGDYNLFIENLQEDDTGSYMCAATTVIGQIGKLESTYLHVAVSAPKPSLPGMSSKENNPGLSTRETGLIVGVAGLGVCSVCLLVAFIIVMILNASTQRQARLPSDADVNENARKKDDKIDF